jgi:hypothetical protein
LVCTARDYSSLLPVGPVQDQSVTASLRRALSDLPSTPNAEITDRLRGCVQAFVDVTKAEGWPIERVIVGLKQVAAEAGLRSSTDILRVRGSLELRDALLLDLVRWCVERYYGYTRQTEEKAGKESRSRVSRPDIV